MSFNGDAGAKFIGDVGSVGTMAPAGAYVSFPVSGVTTTGFWKVNEDAFPRQQVHALFIDGLSLRGWTGGDIHDPALVHTGRLVSAAPGANAHGLPVNFGPGRGAWLADDIVRLLVLTCDDGTQSYLNGPYQNPLPDICHDIIIAAGNVTIDIYNRGRTPTLDGNNAPVMHLNLVYLHSITGIKLNT